MNALQQFCYERVPSFKREHGGLYRLYSDTYSRFYAARMRYLHRHGRHAAQRGLDPRCSWCGAPSARRHVTAYLIVHPRDQKRDDVLIEDPHLGLNVTDGWAVFTDAAGICLAIPAGLGAQIQRVDEDQEPVSQESAPQKE